MSKLFRVENWAVASSDEKEAFLVDLLGKMPSEFSLCKEIESSIMASHYFHRPTGTYWNFIPGGSFVMGLTEGEERAAKALIDPPPLNVEEMRPCHIEEIRPFVMMVHPFLVFQVTKYLKIKEWEDRPFYDKKNEWVPAFLSRLELENLAKEVGFSIPDERQWEYACRGGTKTLFFFGDKIPSDACLDHLLSVDFRESKAFKSNPFGLYSLFSGEWCNDEFKFSYSDECEKKIGYVVRGGGSLFWPWQDSGEWAFCMSATRMPSTDSFGEMAAVRFVLNIVS